MNPSDSASGFSGKSRGIPFDDFGMLPGMPRKAVKNKRKSKPKRQPVTDFQKELVALIEEAGLSKAADFEERSIKMGWRVPASTLSQTLYITTNPTIKTVEAIAHTLQKDPLSIIAKALDEPPEERMNDFGGSIMAPAWELYKKLDGKVDRAHRDLIDRSILRLIEDMEELLEATPPS